MRYWSDKHLCPNGIESLGDPARLPARLCMYDRGRARPIEKKTQNIKIKCLIFQKSIIWPKPIKNQYKPKQWTFVKHAPFCQNRPFWLCRTLVVQISRRRLLYPIHFTQMTRVNSSLTHSVGKILADRDSAWWNMAWLPIEYMFDKIEIVWQ